MNTEVSPHLLSDGGKPAARGISGLVGRCNRLLAGCFQVPDDYEWLRVHIKAALSTYGSIAMWVGGWNLLSPRAKLNSLQAHSGSNILQLPDDVRTFGSFMALGVLLMAMIDTLYPSMGSAANWHPRWCCSNKMICYARAAIAAPAAFLMWVGSYQFFDRGFAPTEWHGLIFDVGARMVMC